MLALSSSCGGATDYTMPQYGVPAKANGSTRPDRRFRAVRGHVHQRELLIGGLNLDNCCPFSSSTKFRGHSGVVSAFSPA